MLNGPKLNLYPFLQLRKLIACIPAHIHLCIRFLDESNYPIIWLVHQMIFHLSNRDTFECRLAMPSEGKQMTYIRLLPITTTQIYTHKHTNTHSTNDPRAHRNINAPAKSKTSKVHHIQVHKLSMVLLCPSYEQKFMSFKAFGCSLRLHPANMYLHSNLNGCWHHPNILLYNKLQFNVIVELISFFSIRDIHQHTNKRWKLARFSFDYFSVYKTEWRTNSE